MSATYLREERFFCLAEVKAKQRNSTLDIGFRSRGHSTKNQSNVGTWLVKILQEQCSHLIHDVIELRYFAFYKFLCDL